MKDGATLGAALGVNEVVPQSSLTAPLFEEIGAEIIGLAAIMGGIGGGAGGAVGGGIGGEILYNF